VNYNYQDENVGVWLGKIDMSSGNTLDLAVTAPICGPITIAHTSAYLNPIADLTLTSTCSIISSVSTGHISAGGNTIFLNGDLSLADITNQIYLMSSLTIDGRGHTLTTIATSGLLTIRSGVTLTLKNMTIKLSDYAIGFWDATSKLVLDNVVVDLQSTTCNTSTLGSIDIKNFVLFRGYGKTLRLRNASGLNILANSCLAFDIGTTLQYYVADKTKFTMADSTSWLYLNGATLKADTSAGATAGLTLTKGTLIMDNKCTLNNGTNTTQGNGIRFGDGVDDVNVDVLAGAQVEVNGYVDWNPA